MKIFSEIMVGLMFLFLIGISIGEDYVVTASLKQSMNDCLYLESLVQGESLLTEEISLAVDDLEYHWANNESGMCFLVNHKNIQEIGTEISKIKAYQLENELTEFRASIESIKSYSQSYLHFMGASLHNVF